MQCNFLEYCLHFLGHIRIPIFPFSEIHRIHMIHHKIHYPYNKLYSRIPGGDNIFKGQSTFVGEISEIRNILKCADDKTLIIGDELCSGTETNSAIAIVSAGILDLIKKESSFIFATHLHELADMNRIKEIEKLNIKHLSVKYNNSKNMLVFDRKLKDGPGDSIYGLEVCRSLDLDSDFLKLANEINLSDFSDTWKRGFGQG